MGILNPLPGQRALPVGDTLVEARLELLADLEEGTSCPCCGQYAKEYPRLLNSNMCGFLISLYMIGDPSEWIHHKHLTYTGRDYSYLSHWGLAETRPSDDEKKHSGYWRITARGVQFVVGQIKAPKYAYLYDNQLRRYSPDKITIRQGLGKTFDYDGMMSMRSARVRA